MPYDREEHAETEWNEQYREMRRVPQHRKKNRHNPDAGKAHLGKPLLTVQLISCTIVLVAAVVLRFVGGELYGTVRDWYWKHLENSILTETDLDEAQTQFWELFPPDGKASSAAPADASSQQTP